MIWYVPFTSGYIIHTIQGFLFYISLSLAQSTDNQGKAAGYLGSVMPIGHVLTPIIAMPIYQLSPEYLYFFSAFLCFVSLLFIMLHPMLRKHEQTSTIIN